MGPSWGAQAQTAPETTAIMATRPPGRELVDLAAVVRGAMIGLRPSRKTFDMSLDTHRI